MPQGGAFDRAGNLVFTDNNHHRIPKGFSGLRPPTVLFITRADGDPTSAASVDFAVTFSGSVTGVDVSDYTVDATGVTGASFR